VAFDAKAKSFSMIDAPVSGGTGGAEAGTLTFMVGGDNQDFEKAKPILACMGKNIVHCGGAGNGQVAKICNNMMLAIEMIATAEGMSLAAKLGMDPKVFAGIANTSSGRCWSSDTYNPYPGVVDNAPASRGYTGGDRSRKSRKASRNAGCCRATALPNAFRQRSWRAGFFQHY
jgi:3-hydroxyisobutyrate dehydrogenase